jgi:hypothetical protein
MFPFETSEALVRCWLGADLRLQGGWSHEGHVPVPLQLMRFSPTKNEDACAHFRQEMRIWEKDFTAKLLHTSILNLPLKVRSTLRNELAVLMVSFDSVVMCRNACGNKPDSKCQRSGYKSVPL